MICPRCGHTIAEQERYLMTADPDQPDWLDILCGDAGEPRRIALTITVCIIAVLIVTGLAQAVGRLG
jgi:hypothetical protein